MNGKLVILSGPSGVGKDTVIDAWQRADPRVERVVAYTTRAPRPGEVDGLDYHFRTVEQFLEMAAAGDFLEYKEVHGNWYATPLKDLDRMLAEGKIAILKIDVQGAEEVFGLRPDAVSIFLLPPSIEELERRIRGRGTESEEKVALRLENAQREIEASAGYRHRLVNSDLGGLVRELIELV